MSKIKRIWQPKHENVLVIEYMSGTVRHAYLGDSYYRLTGTQYRFMESATVIEYDGFTEWR